MPTRTTTREPKLLYRRLDQLLSPGDLRSAQALRDGTFLENLYRLLREELGATGVELYVERGGRFVSEALAGEMDRRPAALDLDAGALASLALDSVVLSEALDGPEPGATLGVAAPRAALLLAGRAPRRRLLAVAFRDEWARERVEFTLHAVRSALDAHLTESRVRGAMREAAEIQRSLLLDQPPDFPGFEIACRSLPAEEVGGDFYDFHGLESDLLGLSIGDASGHGLPAALLVRDVVTGLRMGVGKDLKATSVMRRLNRVIHRSRLSSRFVSVFYGELEANGSLVYVNAGHPPPLLLSADRAEWLSVGGTLIGPTPDACFTRGFAHVDRGGVLVLYTDGLIERADASRELFDASRLERVVASHRDHGAAEILAAIFDQAQAFGASRTWEDDATVVVIKRRPPQ
jgi:sigma-B regulation protein RsbU (phosphoserine phosphatase)